tara:strand:- start:612 stop:1289 length:678 start_codon:yes stop_codon:yes gene_type:complete
MTKKNHQVSFPADWDLALKRESSNNSFNAPLKNVFKELEQNKKITPDINNIFKAFELCKYKSTKVVIFGQDPYFQEGYANGLAFSVNQDKKIPSSLKNIFTEIKSDIGNLISSNGYLKCWADQGVLLLNSSLTVEIGLPGSHSKIGWKDFIIDIVKLLSSKENIVFMLWGNHAKFFEQYIDADKNLILKSSHPSPLSAYRGFFGNKHFSSCNSYLKSKNIKQINW